MWHIQHYPAFKLHFIYIKYKLTDTSYLKENVDIFKRTKKSFFVEENEQKCSWCPLIHIWESRLNGCGFSPHCWLFVPHWGGWKNRDGAGKPPGCRCSCRAGSAESCACGPRDGCASHGCLSTALGVAGESLTTHTSRVSLCHNYYTHGQNKIDSVAEKLLELGKSSVFFERIACTLQWRSFTSKSGEEAILRLRTTEKPLMLLILKSRFGGKGTVFSNSNLPPYTICMVFIKTSSSTRITFA